VQSLAHHLVYILFMEDHEWNTQQGGARVATPPAATRQELPFYELALVRAAHLLSHQVPPAPPTAF
jgi:hypothetical protein